MRRIKKIAGIVGLKSFDPKTPPWMQEIPVRQGHTPYERDYPGAAATTVASFESAHSGGSGCSAIHSLARR
jgi:hypothetical protein